MAPVHAYYDGRSKQNKESSITFTTRKFEKYVDVKLTLEKNSKSPHEERSVTNHVISVEINEKLENSSRIADLFSKSLISGELLVDFITDKLWPELEKSGKSSSSRIFKPGKEKRKKNENPEFKKRRDQVRLIEHRRKLRGMKK